MDTNTTNEETPWNVGEDDPEWMMLKEHRRLRDAVVEAAVRRLRHLQHGALTSADCDYLSRETEAFLAFERLHGLRERD